MLLLQVILLGHAVASGISSKNDKVITLDGAYTLGQKTRPNTTHYRTQVLNGEWFLIIIQRNITKQISVISFSKNLTSC